jgi:hypothetical protein
MIHLFAYGPHIRVDPAGQKRGEKLAPGDWACVMCTVLMSFAETFGGCGPGTCPGAVRSGHGSL